jgi:hypothetical protein
MCGRSFATRDGAGAATGENVFVPTRGAPEESRVRFRLGEATVDNDNASLAILAIAVVLIGCGTSLEAPGLAILYAVVMLPALLAVFVKRRRRLASHSKVGWGETIADLLSGVALAIAILVALPVAAFIALLIFCAVMLASHRPF